MRRAAPGDAGDKGKRYAFLAFLYGEEDVATGKPTTSGCMPASGNIPAGATVCSRAGPAQKLSSVALNFRDKRRGTCVISRVGTPRAVNLAMSEGRLARLFPIHPSKLSGGNWLRDAAEEIRPIRVKRMEPIITKRMDGTLWT